MYRGSCCCIRHNSCRTLSTAPLRPIMLHVLCWTRWTESSKDSSGIAPVSVRRDIAVLVVIHRTVLGRGPSQFRELFKPAPLDRHYARTRPQCSRHRFQLEDLQGQHHWNMLARSALGFVWVYNHLPPKIVEQPSVSSFQAKLQRLDKDRATARCADWAQSFSPRAPLSSHPLLRYR